MLVKLPFADFHPIILGNRLDLNRLLFDTGRSGGSGELGEFHVVDVLDV